MIAIRAIVALIIISLTICLNSVCAQIRMNNIPNNIIINQLVLYGMQARSSSTVNKWIEISHPPKDTIRFVSDSAGIISLRGDNVAYSFKCIMKDSIISIILNDISVNRCRWYTGDFIVKYYPGCNIVRFKSMNGLNEYVFQVREVE